MDLVKKLEYWLGCFKDRNIAYQSLAEISAAGANNSLGIDTVLSEAIAALQVGGEPDAWRYELAHSVSAGPDGQKGHNWQWHIGTTKPTVPDYAIRNLTPLYALRAPVAVTVDDAMLTRFFAEAAKYSIGRDTATFHNKLHLVYKLDATPTEVVFGGDYEACEMFIAKRALSAALAGEVK